MQRFLNGRFVRTTCVVALAAIGAAKARAQPANDNCNNATSIAVPGLVPFNNTNATTDGVGSCAAGFKDVWFSFTAPSTGQYQFDTCTDCIFDSVLSVFDACGGTELLCNDDDCGFQSVITLDATAGTNYKIRAAGFSNSDFGACVLSVVFPVEEPSDPSGSIPIITARAGEPNSLCLTIDVTPGTLPTSTGLAVVADLSQLGGSSTQFFADAGFGCDTVAGDNLFSFSFQIPVDSPTGFYAMPFIVSDAQGRSSTGVIQIGVSAVTQGTPCPYYGPMDVIFVVDDTGSMGGAISQLKSGIGQIVNTINCASLGDYRLGLATFKDQVNVVTNLGGSLASFNAGVTALTAGGGNNTPEASDRGMNAAVNLLAASSNACQTNNFSGGWRAGASKIVVLVTDAVPGGCADAFNSSLYPAVITSAASQGMRIASVFVGGTTSTNSQLRTIMQAYASGTGGCYLEVPGSGAGISSAINECLREGGFGSLSTPAGPPPVCLTNGDLSFGSTENGKSTDCFPARTRDHTTQVFSSSGNVVRTRYANVVAADTGAFSGSENENTFQTDYTVSTNINASPGEEWCVRVDTRRKGELTFRCNGFLGAKAEIGTVSASVSGGSVLLGGLSLPSHSKPFNACNDDLPFDDSSQALIVGVGPSTLTLNFQWLSKVTTRRLNGDDVAVRLGVSGPNPGCLGNKCKSAKYPGDAPRTPTRTASDDGHFVTITCIPCVKPGSDTCKDFNGLFSDPTSSAAVEGFSTSGTIARALYNPGALGAGGGAGGGTPASPDGYIRIEDVAPAPGVLPISLHAPGAFHGKWNCGCYNLEFDVRMPKDGVAGAPSCAPTLTIIRNDGFPNAAGNSASSASFISTTPISEGLGWTHVVIPLPPPGSSTALGTWTLAGGSDWDHLLGNVTSVQLRGDCTAGLGVVDYDNICIKASNDCVRPPNDLVGWWTLDEKVVPLHEIASLKVSSPGPNATGLNGPPTFVNAPKPVKGKVGGALDFDGVDDLVRVSASSPSGNAAPFQIATGNFSIDAWVKTTQGIGELPIVDKRSTSYGAPPTGYRLFLLNGRLAFSMGDAVSPGETVCLSSGPFLATGDWHHVAVTVKRNQPNAAIKLYVNCNLVSQCSPGGKTQPLSNQNADLLIGAGHPIGGPAAYFRGSIDEVELFRRDLTQAEICGIYNARCGKCREYCLSRPYQTFFGPGRISTRICNGTASPKTYVWSLANSSGTGCTISGLTFSPSSGTVIVPPFGCTTINAIVGLLGGMTTTDVACYQFSFTDSEGNGRLCKSSLRKCDVQFCWELIGDAASPVGLSFPGVGLGTPIRFEFSNAGVARTVPYRFEARAEDGTPSLILSLNGLPPGTPVLGTLVAAGGGAISPLSVAASFTNIDMFSGHYIVMLLDLAGNGTFVPVDSVAVLPVFRETECPGEFRDNFDGLAQGSVCAQNGWEQWVGSTDVCGQVSRAQAFDGGQALKIIGSAGGTTGQGDDVVQRVTASGGTWTFRAMTYIPQTATGTGYISMLNTYDDPPGSPVSTYRWSFDAFFNADNNTLSVFRSTPTVPLVKDRWAELRVDIHLATDSVDVSYDGETFITGKSWINGSSNGGQPRIQAIDLYAGEPTTGGISEMYFDAIALTTTCDGPDCNNNGTDDTAELADGGHELDINSNGVLDECESLCDSIDFNNDGSFFDPQDIDAFLSVYSEGSCIPPTATCNDIDFNNDGSVFDPCDIDSFLVSYAEGPCTLCGQ